MVKKNNKNQKPNKNKQRRQQQQQKRAVAQQKSTLTNANVAAASFPSSSSHIDSETESLFSDCSVAISRAENSLQSIAHSIHLKFGYCLEQGNRPHMEDALKIIKDSLYSDEIDKICELLDKHNELNENVKLRDRIRAFAGVYDGHGGVETARLLSNKLHVEILKSIKNLHPNAFALTNKIKKAIKNCFEEFDEENLKRILNRNQGMKPKCTSGSTALCMLITNDLYVYISNVGDCRAVLSRQGKAISLSRDHNVDWINERRRVLNAGGKISRSGTINDILAMSRAFGDYELKRKTPLNQSVIIATPQTRLLQLDLKDEFIILATDGFWDVVSNTDAVKFTRQYLKETPDCEEKLNKVCRQLIDLALSRNSDDNISIIVMEIEKLDE
mmetsp:Transcript_21203/g.36147  ORF Transcript_21203/g.36147 Transcript_21203/m.36147 type:complete len:387 (+) Transcript_21203:807-1967(+)